MLLLLSSYFRPDLTLVSFAQDKQQGAPLDDVIVIDDSSVTCPVCGADIPNGTKDLIALNKHIDSCLINRAVDRRAASETVAAKTRNNNESSKPKRKPDSAPVQILKKNQKLDFFFKK